MNKNRARTRRRLAKRNVYKPDSKAIAVAMQKAQSIGNPKAATPLALDFEIQKRDASGRWRKAPGVPRVHTFGLARLRMDKLQCVPAAIVLTTQHGAYRMDHETAPEYRVRNVKDGRAWDMWTLWG